MLQANSIVPGGIPNEIQLHKDFGVKAMLKIIWSAPAAAIRALSSICEPGEEQRWRADPLSHPVLSRMSQAELADLPIGHYGLPPQRAD